MEDDLNRFLLEENNFCVDVTSMAIDPDPCSCPQPNADGDFDAPGKNPLHYDPAMNSEEAHGMHIPCQWAPVALPDSRGEVPIFSNRNPTTAPAGSEEMMHADSPVEQAPAVKNRYDLAEPEFDFALFPD